MYTGDLDIDPEQMLKKVEKTFNMKIEPTIEFVYLHRRKCVEAQMYPNFTLLGQSLGSMYMAFEALEVLQPGIDFFLSS